MRRVNILGVHVHDCDEDSAVAVIETFLGTPPETPTGGSSTAKQVCTVNPEFVMEARRNRSFRHLINSADLATPDGIGILLAARLLGEPLQGRATGVALVERISDLATQKGYTIFLLGAQPGVANAAGDILRDRYPGLIISDTFAGSPAESDFPEILARLNKAKPNILLVAYGAPKQDLWIRQHLNEFPISVRLAMGVGGVFDYVSGRVPLAPATLRRAGLEWLYRLVKQPWRWRRILRVFAFGLLTIAAALRKRFSNIRNRRAR